MEVIDAIMTGAQEVPPTGSDALGAARMILDPINLIMSGTFTTTGVVSSNAHIHTGLFGANGGVILADGHHRLQSRPYRSETPHA